MKYFKGIETLDELKSEFRRLAMENHPDIGGNHEKMQEINLEFEIAFKVVKKKYPYQVKEETAAEVRSQFYTQNGWAGSRYNSNLDLRDIAPIVRGYVKDVYPTWKFSVVQSHYSMGCSLNVTLMEAPAPIFNDKRLEEFACIQVRKGFSGSEQEAFEYYKKETAKGYMQQWGWYHDAMTDIAREVLSDVVGLVESYRYNDSDAMIDYFSTNFYTSYHIGKWNKPMKVVPKQERLQTSKGYDGAKRIVG